MNKIPLVQTAFLKPLLNSLEKAGVPLAPLSKISGLNHFHLDNTDAYIPVALQYKFFKLLAHQEGLPNLTAEFGQEYQLTQLGYWGKAIANSPDLLTACRDGERYATNIETHTVVHLEIAGPRATLSSSYLYPHGAGRRQSEHFSLLIMLDALRMAGDKDWAPLEIHLTGADLGGLEQLLPVDNTRIHFNQPAVAIVFPTAMLARPMNYHVENNTLENIAPPSTTLAARIEQLLSNFDSIPITSLSRFAEIVEVAPRTLQRHLATEGTAFSEVVDNWRLKQAVNALSDPSVTIAEIAQRLNYANSANFDRAFRRWTGTIPTDYRDALPLT